MPNTNQRTESLLQELLEAARHKVHALPFSEAFYDLHDPQACQNALKNPEKNYENYWGYPFDHNMITTVQEYINASPMPIGSHRYIAAQGPRKNTLDEFWEMVWHEKVSIIVSVTNEREHDGRKEHFKFDRFWPEGHQVHRGFTVETVQEETVKEWDDGRKESLVARKISLKNGGETRSCIHLHMLNWPDNGVIQPDSLLELSRHLDERKEDGAILVHCAAGIGRTGTVIAFHSLFHDLSAYLKGEAQSFDPHLRVEEMRKLRWGAIVAAPEQYHLVIDALTLALRNSSPAYRPDLPSQ